MKWQMISLLVLIVGYADLFVRMECYHTLAKNNTLELDSQQIEFEWKYLLDGDSTLRMKHAQQFRESGEIES
jgi:hypothetical protein